MKIIVLILSLFALTVIGYGDNEKLDFDRRVIYVKAGDLVGAEFNRNELTYIKDTGIEIYLSSFETDEEFNFLLSTSKDVKYNLYKGIKYKIILSADGVSRGEFDEENKPYKLIIGNYEYEMKKIGKLRYRIVSLRSKKIEKDSYIALNFSKPQTSCNSVVENRESEIEISLWWCADESNWGEDS